MNIINKLGSTALFGGLLASALVLGTGCSQQGSKEIFEQSPSERIDARSKELADRLVSSPNGWIMEYVPNNKAAYGGYIIGFKFNDKGQVLISSEAMENTEAGATEIIHPAIKSSYTIGRDVGVALNFPDYNEALHYYSTPDRRYAADYGKGYEGDSEFRYMESENPDVLNFVGKKTGNKMRLYRASEDAIEYVKKVVAMKRQMYNPKQMIADHQDALVASKPILGKEGLTLYYLTQEGYNYYDGKEDEDSEKSVKMRFFYTPTGVKFFDPESGKTESYTWNADKRVLEAGSDVIEPRNDPYYDDYTTYLGDYLLTIEGGDGRRVGYNVKFEAAGRNLYLLKGLPYDVQVQYDYKNKRFGITTQAVDNSTALCAWGWKTTERGTLHVATGYGMYSELIPGSNPEQYRMVDNGVWGLCDSYILWRPGVGEGTSYQPSRLGLPVFIRK